MDIGLKRLTGIITGPLFLTFFLLAMFLPFSAHAVQWKMLAQTSRHNVALEMNSIQNNPDGNISVWLLFTPRDAQQRKEAANEYSQKKYYQHLEYYEIDCNEESATLKQLDILAKNGKRLARLTENSPKEIIIPGSVLDITAGTICPDQESDVINDNLTQDAPLLSDKEFNPDKQAPEEKKRRIEDTKKKAEAEPLNYKNWADLGNVYYDSEMTKEAIEAYDKSLKLKPDNIDVLNDQAVMLRRIGNFQSALKNLEMVLTIDPNNLDSIYSIGYIYAIELNRTKDALPYWHRYLAIDKSSETANQIRQYIDKYGK